MRIHRTINPAVLLALIPFAWLVSHFWWTCDDAFISFRYVQHLVRGDGLIFNPGESPPVEGFTNLLWILVLSPFHSLGLALPFVANGISAACGMLLMAMMVQFLTRRGAELWDSGAYALVFVTLPPIAIWATSGLETMPFTLAVFSTYMVLVESKGKQRVFLACLCAFAASLLRADGALWCGFAFVASLLSYSEAMPFDRQRQKDQWRAVLATGVLLTLGVALHFAWRYSYFGEWLPNTAKIKAGFTMLRAQRGVNYLLSLLLAVPALALIPLLALPFMGRMRRGAGFGLGALAFVALGLTYCVYVGGDFMAMGRLVVPTLPFFVLILAATGQSIGKRSLVLMPVTALVGLGLLGCFGKLPVPSSWYQAAHFRWNQDLAHTELEQWNFMGNEVKDNRRLGRALALHTLPGEKLVRGNIGAIGYYSDIVLLDVNGLVIPEVASSSTPVERASPGHDRRVGAAFFRDWQPDYQYATILPASLDPHFGFTPRWKALLRRGKLVLERRALRPEDGFELGTELRLLRDVRLAAPKR